MGFHQPPSTFVNEIQLKVTDFERSLTFYQDMLGFQILDQTGELVRLTVDGEKPLITLTRPDDILPKQPRTTGLYHFAILLPDRVSLGALLQHLVRQKYPLQGASDHLVSEAVYLADPDGNGIELYIDRPSSEWTWSNGEVKMTTDPLDAESLLAEGASLIWKQLPAGTVLGHIHMHVSDFRDIEDFYCTGLGFEVVTKFGDQALFISSEGYHHHIGLNTWAGVGASAPPENSVGITWFEVVFPSSDAKHKAIERLEKLDFSIEEKDNEFYTSDPSKNKIKLSVF
ncbi:glyoxalase [Salipaludibacillus neizhouensis]|uniref:Glyoxalase n=1 Tax=Salipaludibacillus neizhouensis TaxID=885475 RepID=A0A3A9K685_9BACI|nr:VOC family protein [Salipaludibacillus neizhouensis]RKL66370.1 glyoxalase [Salipaludibacillus neizhouensis]